MNNVLTKDLKVLLMHVYNILLFTEDVEIDLHVADFVNEYYKNNQEFLNLECKDGRYLMSKKFKEVCMNCLGYDVE